MAREDDVVAARPNPNGRIRPQRGSEVLPAGVSASRVAAKERTTSNYTLSFDVGKSSDMELLSRYGAIRGWFRSERAPSIGETFLRGKVP